MCGKIYFFDTVAFSFQSFGIIIQGVEFSLSLQGIKLEEYVFRKPRPLFQELKKKNSRITVL